MTGADVLLAVLALGVAILLGRGSHPLVAALLVVSALAVSAVLFLPTAMLASLVGMERVHGLYDLTRPTPLDPPEWIHLIVFAWLGFLLWLARRDIRNWRGVALVAALGIAAELSQWLTDGREPKVEDAALNVLGVSTWLLRFTRSSVERLDAEVDQTHARIAARADVVEASAKGGARESL